MSRRRNKGLFPLQPLARPTSTLLLRCYAREGRNWSVIPPDTMPLQLLLIDPATRAWRWEPGMRSTLGPWCCETLQAPWRVAGWIPADGSLPHGEPDELDPSVARLDFCASPQRHAPAHDQAYRSHDDSPHYR